MSDRSFDMPEMVVREILRAFDQGKAVAYPGRPSVRFATWLPRLLPRGLIVSVAAMATRKMGLALPQADLRPVAGTTVVKAPDRDGRQQAC